MCLTLVHLAGQVHFTTFFFCLQSSTQFSLFGFIGVFWKIMFLYDNTLVTLPESHAS